MIRLPNGKLTIARGPDGTLVGVLDVPRGRRCGCVCPDCGQPLVAKVGPDRAGHFAHARGAMSCAGMGAWHELVRDCICRLKQIDFGRCPPVPRLAGVQRVIRGHSECWILDRGFRPDAVLETQAGIRLAVEVVDTHEVDGFKLAALLQEQWLVLRIDVPTLQSHMSGRSIQKGLPEVLSQAGPWQSWPTISHEWVQTELPLENVSAWLRAVGWIAGAPCNPLLSRNP